jgi:hypothetical protein
LPRRKWLSPLPDNRSRRAPAPEQHDETDRRTERLAHRRSHRGCRIESTGPGPKSMRRPFGRLVVCRPHSTLARASRHSDRRVPGLSPAHSLRAPSPQLHEVPLADLRGAGLLDMDDAAVDGSHVRALKGGSHRTFAGRPGSARQQAPLDRRPAWHSLGRLADQRKPSRRHSADAIAGRDTPRATASPAAPVFRRPRLRPRQMPSASPGSRHHIEDRPQRHSPWLRPGQDPLGRRADLRLAAPVQATQNPLRDTRRPSPGSTPTRVQHHLLETTPNLTLKPSARNHARGGREQFDLDRPHDLLGYQELEKGIDLGMEQRSSQQAARGRSGRAGIPAPGTSE